MNKFAFGWKTAVPIIIIGLIVCVFSIINALKPRDNLVPVKAVISYIDVDYDVTDDTYNYTTYVDYEFEGQKYERVPFGRYDSSYHEGMEIDILVNPDKPGETDYEGSATSSIIIGVVGAVAVIIGVVGWIRGGRFSAA